MLVGMHIMSFTWPDGPARIAAELARTAGRLAEIGIDLALVLTPPPDDDAAYHRLAEVIRQAAPLGRDGPEPLSRVRAHP